MVDGPAVKVGTWGGTGGTPWSFNPELLTYEGRLVTIVINYGDCINSLTFTYKDHNGTIYPPQKIGGDGGPTTGRIDLADDEVIIGIAGTFGRFAATSEVIRSLSILTNKQKYGPYGMDVGTPFKLPVPKTDSKIVGFFGYAGDLIDAIGAYVKAI